MVVLAGEWGNLIRIVIPWRDSYFRREQLDGKKITFRCFIDDTETQKDTKQSVHGELIQ